MLGGFYYQANEWSAGNDIKNAIERQTISPK